MSNDGKDLELLVQLIEKSIDPDATVEHNVLLPVLTSPTNRTRQCDIVIRQGKPPRETLTIVEVQDRNSAVDINTFGGWMKKLKGVGAQHLICVSRQDFPDSIKEEVMQSGNTVRLITLKEMPTDGVPLDIYIGGEFRDFDMKPNKNIEIKCLNEELKEKLNLSVKWASLNLNEPCFSLDKNNLISLFNVCRNFFIPKENELSGIATLEIGHKEHHEFWLYRENTFIPISLTIEFDWTNQYIKIPINLLSYEQDSYGTLAWLLDASLDTKFGLLAFKIPLIKSKDGYKINYMTLKLPEKIELSINKIKKRT